MGLTLLGSSYQNIITNGQSIPFGGRGIANSTEANRQYKINVAGKISNLGVSVDGTGTARTCKSRVGGVTKTLNPTITDSTIGQYRDDVNSDAIAVGDLVNFLNNSTGNPTYYWVAMGFTAAGGHTSIYLAGSNGVSSGPNTGSDNFCILHGFPTFSATETDTSVLVRVAGTRARIGVKLNGNSFSVATTVKSRKNGADGNISFTIASGSGSGYFEDDGTQSDTLAVGDTISTDFLVPAGTGSMNPMGVTCQITAAQGNAGDVFIGSGNGPTRAASATVHFIPPIGQIENLTSTSETERRLKPGFACTIRNFRFKCTANTYSVNGSVVLRKNGADAITLALTAASTTLIEDTTSFITLSATDDISISIVGGSTGSVTFGYLGYTLDSGPATPSTLGWFEPPERFIAPLVIARVEQPSSYAPKPPPVAPPVNNIGWFIPPDRNPPPRRIFIESSPVFAPRIPPAAGSGFFARYYYDMIAGRAH